MFRAGDVLPGRCWVNPVVGNDLSSSASRCLDRAPHCGKVTSSQGVVTGLSVCAFSGSEDRRAVRLYMPIRMETTR